ncbi:MAG: ferrous iron transport protein A, partial [Thiobacillaceae bacterium]|nr:ferrous iron transport protein A [Thiobacillaceae bacterium]
MTPPCPLHTLPVGRCGTILSIDAPAELAARMRALGLQPGRRIKVIRRSPFQGP